MITMNILLTALPFGKIFLFIFGYLVIYLFLMQFLVEGKANFHPIYGIGIDWLKEELKDSEVSDISSHIRCKKASPLRAITIYNRSRFPTLLPYSVLTEDGLSYGIWRFTKADAILRRHFKANKKPSPKYLKFTSTKNPS